MRRFGLAAALLAGLALARPAAAQEPAAFVATLGHDTVAIERYTRLPGRIEGRQVIRTPSTSIRDYTAYLRSDGTISRWEMSMRGPDGALRGLAAIDFLRDTAVVQFRRGARIDSTRIAAPRGSVPWLIYSPAVYEPAIAYARRLGRTRFQSAMIPLGGTETMPLSLHLSRDSALMTNIAGPNVLHLDRAGRVTTFDSRESTEHFIARPAPGLDVDALAAQFAERDRAGTGLGSLTPLDSVRARFGDAELSVRYSRPFKRGRTIFGGLEPWGRVWRTGANQATHFTTTRDLVIGGTPVPAGTYTLFSIPSQEQWTLIINRQTGQFGTDYDPAQDLARIPMTRQPLATPVEQFTIALEPDGAGGRLALIWDDTRVWVPVEVK